MVAIGTLSPTPSNVARASILSFMGDMLGVNNASASTIPDDGTNNTMNSQTLAILEAPNAPDPTSIIPPADVTINNAALVADTGPVGTSADVAGTEGNSDNQTILYVTPKGATLSQIAAMFDLKTDTLLAANPDVKKGVALSEGQVLVIPPTDGVLYTIQKGDTLAGIAKKYKVDSAVVGAFNGVTDKSTLSAGDVLMIPDAVVSKPKTSSSSTVNKRQTSGIITVPAHHGRAWGISGPAYPGYYVHPVTPGQCRITQGVHDHNAVDCAGRSGTPIYAAADGVVVTSKFTAKGAWFGGFGNFVLVVHSNGSHTLYAHLRKNLVQTGDHVSAGQQIGEMGSTGNSTGTHLHFEVWDAQNPYADNSFAD